MKCSPFQVINSKGKRSLYQISRFANYLYSLDISRSDAREIAISVPAVAAIKGLSEITTNNLQKLGHDAVTIGIPNILVEDYLYPTDQLPPQGSGLIQLEYNGQTILAEFNPEEAIDKELEAILEDFLLEKGGLGQYAKGGPPKPINDDIVIAGRLDETLFSAPYNENQLHFLAWRAEEQATIEKLVNDKTYTYGLQALNDIFLTKDEQYWYIVAMPIALNQPATVLFAVDRNLKDVAEFLDFSTELIATAVAIGVGLGLGSVKRIARGLKDWLRKALKEDSVLRSLLERIAEKLARKKTNDDELYDLLKKLLKNLWNQHWDGLKTALKNSLRGLYNFWWAIWWLIKWILALLSAGASKWVELASALAWLGVKIYR